MRGGAWRFLSALLSLPAAETALGQTQSYTYVQFPLDVPWTLYFIFLVLVSIPFAVMIALAWRHYLRQERKPDAE